MNGDVILGGFYHPQRVGGRLGAGRARSCGSGRRRRACSRCSTTPRSRGWEVTRPPFGRPRIRAVVTARGTIEVDQVVIACGVWSPRVAAMAGASNPPHSRPSTRWPTWAPSTSCTDRQRDRLPHRARHGRLHVRAPEPRRDGGRLGTRTAPSSCTPTTSRRWPRPSARPPRCRSPPATSPPRLDHAREIMGGLLAGSENALLRERPAVADPDAQQVLGETAEVEKLWSAAAVWIKEGPGTARLIAEWITHGYPRLCDPHGSDVTRFYPHERTLRHIRQRCREHFNKTYGIVHPREQWASGRGMNARRSTTDRRPSGRSSTRRAAGSVRSGTRRTPTWSSATASRTDPTVGPAVVVADHQCRASPASREGGRRRSERVPGLRRVRPRRRALPRTARRQPLRRARRPLGLHAAADRRAASAPISPFQRSPPTVSAS